MIIDVLGKYQIPLGADIESVNYAKFAIGRKLQFDKQCLCAEKLFSHLEKGLNVLEICGGIGKNSVILHGWSPTTHSIWDIDTRITEHLKLLTCSWSGISVNSGDAYINAEPVDGLLSCDFFTFNLARLIRGSIECWAINRLLSSRPKYLHITDTGIHFLHLHKKLYSQLSAERIENFDDYVSTFSMTTDRMWGYTIKYVYSYSRSVSYFLLTQGSGDIKICYL